MSCLETSSWGKTSLTPAASAAAATRSSAGPIAAGRPCVSTAAQCTGLAGRGVDPVVELIGMGRIVCLLEMKKELAIALRAGQPGVYDPGDASSPAERRIRDLVQDAAVDGLVADDAFARLYSAGLELGLHEF